MKIGELRKAAGIWRETLCLQHWRIKVVLGRACDGEPCPFSRDLPENLSGLCWWAPESINSTIVIRRGEGVHTLVHEMLHLRLEGHKENPRRYDPHYERALNHIVDALVGKPDLIG